MSAYCCIELDLFINPLNAKLNPILHLLALLGAHPILHVSMIRVNIVLRALVIDCTFIYYAYILIFFKCKIGRFLPCGTLVSIYVLVLYVLFLYMFLYYGPMISHTRGRHSLQGNE